MNPTTVHQLKRFIKFFEAIPRDKWHQETYHSPDGKRHCALGHLLKSKMSKDATKLQRLMSPLHPGGHLNLVAAINDGKSGFLEFGDSPKERIMTALNKRLEMEVANEPK
jgi:hypothetical protein